MKRKKRQGKAAFFDADGTLFRWSWFIHWVEEMVRMNLVSRHKFQRVSSLRKRWEEREGTYDDYIAGFIDLIDGGVLKGISLVSAERAATCVVKRFGKKNYIFTRELHRSLRACGYKTFLVSHSPSFAVEAYAKALGFTDFVGTVYEVGSDGRFTGQRLKADKVNALKVLAGLHNCTLRHSMAVGDTASDLPMLLSVTHPITINPEASLADEARARSIPIVIERKNLILVLRTPKPGEKVVFRIEDTNRDLRDAHLEQILPAGVARHLRRSLKELTGRLIF